MNTLNNRLMASACDAFPGGGFLARLVYSETTAPAAYVNWRSAARAIGMMLLALGSALCWIPEAAAATKYVATTGSDTNDGNSISTPYRTIAKGLQNIGTAGTLYIRGGTYEESITNVLPSGTSNTTRTVVQNYGNEIVTIRPSSGLRVIDVSAKLYVTIRANAPHQIILDGVNCTSNAVKFAISGSGVKCEYIRMENLEVKNGKISGIAGGFIFSELINLRVHSNGSHDQLDHGVYMGGSDNVIDGCEFYGNSSRAVHIYSGTGSEGGVNASRNVVKNCRIHSGGGTSGKPVIEIYTGDANKVYNNIVYGNTGTGINIGSSATNTGVYNNTCYNNQKYGIAVTTTAGTGNTLRNNICYANVLGNVSLGVTVTQSNNLWDGTNPQFVSTNPANADYLKIQSGSPARNAGTNTSPISTLVTTDHWGTSRPQESVYDIGAHEYMSSVPAAPSSLTATKAASPNNYRQINLSWADNSDNETGFKIDRKKGSGGTYSEIATTGANVVTYNDTTCGSGTTYYYRVRAYNGSGNSAYSNEASATTDEVTSGRRGHWKLDETSGTTAADSSGNGNTGTLQNGPAWSAGKIGNCLNFDGVNDVVSCGSGSTLDNLPALTICAWINANSMGGGGLARIVQKSAWSPQAGWFFYLSGTNQLGLSVDYSSPKLARISTTNAISTGQWLHVMVTWTGSSTATNVKIYVNGVEVSGYATTTNGGSTRVDDNASSLFIGNDSTGVRGFDGRIDDVRVYNRVLTTNEILAVYRAGL